MEIAEALDHAVAAHAKWKYRLMEAIDAGQSEWRVTMAVLAWKDASAADPQARA